MITGQGVSTRGRWNTVAKCKKDKVVGVVLITCCLEEEKRCSGPKSDFLVGIGFFIQEYQKLFGKTNHE